MATTRLIRPDAVLLVEDKDSERALYKEWLEDMGFVVIDVGTKALALMHLDRLDLNAIVLDLRLPNGHGREVVESLVSKRDDVAVVVVTALPDPPIFGDPVTATLRKPIARSMFVNAVTTASNASRDKRSIRRSTRKLLDASSRPLVELPPEEPPAVQP